MALDDDANKDYETLNELLSSKCEDNDNDEYSWYEGDNVWVCNKMFGNAVIYIYTGVCREFELCAFEGIVWYENFVSPKWTCLDTYVLFVSRLKQIKPL